MIGRGRAIGTLHAHISSGRELRLPSGLGLQVPEFCQGSRTSPGPCHRKGVERDQSTIKRRLEDRHERRHTWRSVPFA